MASVSEQPAYVKLSDVAGLVESVLNRPVSRQMAYKITGRRDFPKPDAEFPFRLWKPATIYAWIRETLSPDESEKTYDKKTNAVELRQWIRSQGGLRRDILGHWDSSLTNRENRRMYQFLDKKWGEGRGLDDIGQEIGCAFPEFGITDADSLWDWLQDKPDPDDYPY